MQPSRHSASISALFLGAMIAANAINAEPAAPHNLSAPPNQLSAASASDSRGPSAESPAMARAREEFAQQVERNVDALENTMAAARRSAFSLDPQSQRVFLRISRDVGTAARELHRSLNAMRRANGEEWDKARALLASDYENYAQAVAQAQRIAMLSTSTASRGLTLDAR